MSPHRRKDTTHAMADESDKSRAALRGETVPAELDSDLTIRCVIRGIRYNDGYATELRDKCTIPSITRALNARAIMSNRIPHIANDDEMPYCFWHPDVPNEQTLRQLLQRYPESAVLRYGAGRACAVAGYASLYRELDLLPEVSIAEEARDGGTTGGKEIFDVIMSQPTRYAVMDDYRRALHDPPVPDACLNGDMCTRSALECKQIFPDPQDSRAVLRPPRFDITEDWGIDTTGTRFESKAVSHETLTLLHKPLPRDLPAVDKDLLILLAAWSGNIDRYVRLRRPTMISGERQCVVRGIYHDSLFARWCYEELDSSFRKYAYARFVMNGDLSWLTDDVADDDLPDLIWHPDVADGHVYEELARRRPTMKASCAHACIVGNAPGPFVRIDPPPVASAWVEADACLNREFAQLFERKATLLGTSLGDLLRIQDESTESESRDERYWDTFLVVENGGPIRPQLCSKVTLENIGFMPPEGADDAPTKNIRSIFAYDTMAPRVQVPAGYELLDLTEVYRDAPFVEAEVRPLLGLYPNPRRPEGGYRRRGGSRGRGCPGREAIEKPRL
ncbi:hypothetical protein JDV02_004779 [Purpureocillium takamizusanense]|uniref:Uncharacterized protein n=1 Tax=Purpureocillium takamizusanense TaxID=2060973 RepID=A0A9Q8V9Q3_9HYPO|nr:uncharacterized protein JDV02_004779 [Purpureocillium takamizusanense]UNI18515.1 hypothetical protein JDV02_004779 [Purpureocillium takamizusanense]